MKLILFDIDGTMLLNGAIAQSTFLETFANVVEVEPHFDGLSFAGATDRGIFEQLYERSGSRGDAEALFARFCREYPHSLRQRYPQAPDPYMLPGVSELLGALASVDSVALGLATGNLRESAYIKLGRFGLEPFFPTGGFGGEHSRRDQVFAAAISNSRDHYAIEHTDPPWVIGDTQDDVRAGRSVGARVLAVATGFHSREALGGADYVVDDLTDTQAVLELLLS